MAEPGGPSFPDQEQPSLPPQAAQAAASLSGSAPKQPATAGNTASPCIVLTGNPNSGKTTVFNALTGLRAKVGNYAGVTVERKEGKLLGSPAGSTPRS